MSPMNMNWHMCPNMPVRLITKVTFYAYGAADVLNEIPNI